MPRVNLIQVRRGTESEWTTADPTLAAGEIGFISDTNEIVIGDGSTAFTGLTPIGGGGGGSGLSDNYDDIDELIADQANQELNGLYYVGDASDDPTVDSGWAVYRYLGTTDGDLDDYQKLSEEESLDVLFNVLGTVLTGYTAGSNAAIAAGDTILQAFGKTQGQLNAKLNTGNNAGLAGTGLKFVYANADGQIVRNGNVSYNTTTGEMRIDGLSSIADDFSLSIYNDANEMIMRVSNGKYVEYGGSSSFWEVQTGISDGNAGIIFLPSQDAAYRMKDTASFDYAICKSSTSGYGRAFIIKQKQVNDHGVGFQTVRRQFKLTLPNTTAGAAHVVGSIPIPSGSGISVHVLRAWAYATNGNMISCEPFSAIGNNTGGTTSGTSTTPTAIRVTATTGGFSVVWNDTTDAADIVFTNETGTGRQYDVQVDIEYILSPIPV
jgi:hypothetical protein